MIPRDSTGDIATLTDDGATCFNNGTTGSDGGAAHNCDDTSVEDKGVMNAGDLWLLLTKRTGK